MIIYVLYVMCKICDNLNLCYVMICNCLFLEKKALINCPNLVNFKLSGKSSRLGFLDLKGCDRLKYIEFNVENLEILEYTSPIDCFSFKHVLKIAEVYLHFYGINE